MSERKQLNIRLTDDDFEKKIAAIRREMVLADPTRVPSTADVLRAAVDYFHRDLTRGRKRA